MRGIYREVTKSLPAILKKGGTNSICTVKAFKDICFAASTSADKIVVKLVARKRTKR
jgi:hypothetical protein